MNLHKVTKIAALGVAVLSLIFLALIMASSDADSSSWISVLIYLSYIILFACVAVVLIYVFKNLSSDKDALKSTLMTVGILVGLLVVSFLIANGDDVYSVKKELLVSGSASKIVSTGLNMSYILGSISLFSVLFFMIKNAKK
jgi:NADH:ubiquinone oxidoreductase subunit 6 (subunit J)